MVSELSNVMSGEVKLSPMSKLRVVSSMERSARADVRVFVVFRSQ